MNLRGASLQDLKVRRVVKMTELAKFARRYEKAGSNSKRQSNIEEVAKLEKELNFINKRIDELESRSKQSFPIRVRKSNGVSGSCSVESCMKFDPSDYTLGL